MRILHFLFFLWMISCSGTSDGEKQIFNENDPHAYMIIAPAAPTDTNKIFNLENTDSVMPGIEMLIQSYSVIQKTLKKIGQKVEEKEVKDIQRRLRLDKYENNGRWNVKFYHEDKDFAENFLNELGEISIETEKELKNRRIKKRLTYFHQMLDSTNKKLRLAEEKLMSAHKNGVRGTALQKLMREVELHEKYYLLLLEKEMEFSIISAGYEPAAIIELSPRYTR